LKIVRVIYKESQLMKKLLQSEKSGA